MRRYFIAMLAAALTLPGFVAAATTADAHHKRYRSQAAVAVYVRPSRVAAFRRSYVDRHIGPSGAWVDRQHYYYRPYHYWRGLLVYRQTPARWHGHFAHASPTKFVCRGTKHGPVCRER